MNKNTKTLYLANIIVTLAFAVITFIALPEKIALGFTDAEYKSKYFLILLSVLPFATTFLFSLSDNKPVWSIGSFAIIEIYCLLLVLACFGFNISMEPIVFAALCVVCFLLASLLQKNQINIALPWIKNEENIKKVNKFASGIFIVLALIFATNTICRPLELYSQMVAVFSALGFAFVSVIAMLFTFKKKN